MFSKVILVLEISLSGIIFRIETHKSPKSSLLFIQSFIFLREKFLEHNWLTICHGLTNRQEFLQEKQWSTLYHINLLKTKNYVSQSPLAVMILRLVGPRKNSHKFWKAEVKHADLTFEKSLQSDKLKTLNHLRWSLLHILLWSWLLAVLTRSGLRSTETRW